MLSHHRPRTGSTVTPHPQVAYQSGCHIVISLTWKSLQVSNFANSGQELVPPGVSVMIRGTGLLSQQYYFLQYFQPFAMKFQHYTLYNTDITNRVGDTHIIVYSTM